MIVRVKHPVFVSIMYVHEQTVNVSLLDSIFEQNRKNRKMPFFETVVSACSELLSYPHVSLCLYRWGTWVIEPFVIMSYLGWSLRIQLLFDPVVFTLLSGHRKIYDSKYLLLSVMTMDGRLYFYFFFLCNLSSTSLVFKDSK